MSTPSMGFSLARPAAIGVNLPASPASHRTHMTIRPRILQLILMGLALFTGSAQGITMDDQLNAAYKKVLSRSDVDAEGLQWLEVHWIAYRDAEANMEAWFAGQTKPDEAVHSACVEYLTGIRLHQLQHLAQTGTFDDLPMGTYSGSDSLPGKLSPNYDETTSRTSATLRAAVLARKQPALIAALIRSEKAWLEFSGLQEDNEGIKDSRDGSDPAIMARNNLSSAKLDLLRLNELQHAASFLPVSLAASDEPSTHDDEINEDSSTFVSTDGTLRIEQPDQDQSWVISSMTGKRTRLAEIDHDADTNSGNTGMQSEYYISPDDRWILRTGKIYHGLDGVYLYERASSTFAFQPATREPLDVMAWKFFRKATQCPPFDYTAEGVVNFASWKPGVLRISLNASKNETFADVNDFVMSYDLQKGRFSIPRELAAHDHAAFDAASQRPSP
jgi:uncharacterized protein YecT (DUF1311 family)